MELAVPFWGHNNHKMADTFQADDLLNQLKESHQSNVLQKLVRRELPRVYNLCLRLCHKPTDAEDLCQDVFVRALRALPDFRGESALSTWLHRIAVNTWKNRVRHEKRRKFHWHVSLNVEDPDDERTGVVFNLPDGLPVPEEYLAKKEDLQQILKAMEYLSHDEKTIIVLRDMEEKTYEEISAILDLNIGTVKSRLARAREQLRVRYYQIGGKVP